MTVLNARTLCHLPPRVSVPAYERSMCSVGTVHFGVGAFHRSHEAMFMDRALALGSTTWSICGVGTTQADRPVRDALRRQDNLYTLVTVAPDGRAEARVIGSITEYLYVPEGPQRVLDRLVDERTRIVSLTITEGGYAVDDSTGEFTPRDPLLLEDLEPDSQPTTVFGLIVAALALRRESGSMPFTVVSCDNVPRNGEVARTAVLGVARHRASRAASWIEDAVAFPSSMVDRITPATTDETRASTAAEFGVEDLWPVRSESFCQWVLEDRFVNGRPPLEMVGAQMVDDVGPYELMKLRLLNASHQAMSHLGLLSGWTWVHEVCRDPLFARFLRSYMSVEAVPTLEPVPGIDLDRYCDELIARFASEAIQDTLARQVVDSSDRIPKFLLPVVRSRLDSGGDIRRSVLVLAAWSVLIEQRLAGGGLAAVTDRRREELAGAVTAEGRQPGAFLDYGPVFGDLGQVARLRSDFVAARAILCRHGARAAVAAIVEGPGTGGPQ